MSNLTLAKVKEEFLSLIPPTIFFFIALHVIALIRSLFTAGTGLPPFSSLQIFIAALIIGKAVLLADLLPGVNMFPEKPLAYNIVWKTLIYYVIASLIHYLERLYDASKAAGGIAAGNEKLLADMIWPHFWGTQIVVLVIILNYCVIRELGRAMGAKHVFSIFFRSELPRFSD